MKKILMPLLVTLALAQSAVAVAQSVPMVPMIPVLPHVDVRPLPVIDPPVFTCQALHTCPTPGPVIDPPPPPAPCTSDRDCGTVKIDPQPTAINQAR